MDERYNVLASTYWILAHLPPFMPHWTASHHMKSDQAISFHFTWYIIIHKRKSNLGYKHYFYVSVFMRDNPVCYLHGMQFRKLFPTSFLLSDLGITYVWWYVIFSAVIFYSKITVLDVMTKRKAAIAQGVILWCIWAAQKWLRWWMFQTNGVNAPVWMWWKRATMTVSVLTATHFSPRVIDV